MQQLSIKDFKRLREQLKLTQYQLARKAGLKRYKIAYFEAGYSGLQIEDWVRLREVLEPNGAKRCPTCGVKVRA